ncbi:hypothetical protein OEZ86_004572 [Tetradesmus obliquus]|nr:hypothetical protein OEZ86_004572 [Tetradesmus obliquus]
MQEDRTSPTKKSRLCGTPVTQLSAPAAHEWTGNAAIINNVVHLLSTGQDVLRCELVNSTWHSSATSQVLPPMCLSSQALNKTSPLCLRHNGRRLAALRVAFLTETISTRREVSAVTRATNQQALAVVANAATNLVTLTIDDAGCSLQDSPWRSLTSLTRLDLNNSGAYNLPSSLGALTGLQHLSIYQFTQLGSLVGYDEDEGDETPWVQQLTNLTMLSVTRTNRFNSIGGPLPASLQELNLDENPVFEYLPENIGELTRLQSLTLSGPMMKCLPQGIGSLPQLSRLFFNKCDRLGALPDNFAQSTSMRSLGVICNNLNRGQIGSILNDDKTFSKPPGYLGEGGLQKMPAVTSLAISLPRSSWILQGAAPTASLSCLTSLQIFHSPILLSSGELGLESFLAGLPALRSLQLSGIAKVESFESLTALTGLTSLTIDGAEGIVALPSFERLGLLQRLVLKGCSSVKVLSGMQGLTSLTHLRLHDMMSLGSLPAELGELKQLRELIVYFCPCVRKFPASLQQLQLQLLSIGSLNERCAVARRLVASAKQRDAFRYPTDLGLTGAVAVVGGGIGMVRGGL